MINAIILSLIAVIVFVGLFAAKWKITAMALSHLMMKENFTFDENEFRESVKYVVFHLLKP